MYPQRVAAYTPNGAIEQKFPTYVNSTAAVLGGSSPGKGDASHLGDTSSPMRYPLRRAAGNAINASALATPGRGATPLQSLAHGSRRGHGASPQQSQEEILQQAAGSHRILLDYTSTSIQPGHGTPGVHGRSPSPPNDHRGQSPERHTVTFGSSGVDQEGMQATGCRRFEGAVTRAHERLNKVAMEERWNRMAHWLDKYFDDADSRTFANVTHKLYTEVSAATASRPQPNALRTATSCMLFEQLLHIATRLQPELRPVAIDIRQEMLASIYIAAPSTVDLDKNFFFLESPTDVEGQEKLISRFYGKTYYQATRELGKKLSKNSNKYEHTERVKDKQMKVLGRATDFWQMYLCKRLLLGWRGYVKSTRSSKNRDAEVQSLRKEKEELLHRVQEAELRASLRTQELEKEVSDLQDELVKVRGQLAVERDFTSAKEHEVTELTRELADYRGTDYSKNVTELKAKIATMEEMLMEQHVAGGGAPPVIATGVGADFQALTSLCQQVVDMLKNTNTAKPPQQPLVEWLESVTGVPLAQSFENNAMALMDAYSRLLDVDVTAASSVEERRRIVLEALMKAGVSQHMPRLESKHLSSASAANHVAITTTLHALRRSLNIQGPVDRDPKPESPQEWERAVHKVLNMYKNDLTGEVAATIALANEMLHD